MPLEVESSPGNRIGALRLLLLAALTPVLLAAQCAIHEAAHYAVALTQGGKFASRNSATGASILSRPFG